MNHVCVQKPNLENGSDWRVSLYPWGHVLSFDFYTKSDATEFAKDVCKLRIDWKFIHSSTPIGRSPEYKRALAQIRALRNQYEADRHVEFSFVQPLATELREKVCAQLQVWIDVVWRSGFAPQGERPGDCGAIPTVAYPYDSHTVAIDFEQIFRVDEACFSSLVAYANRLASDGTPLSTLRIE